MSGRYNVLVIEAWGVCSVMKVLVLCSAEVNNLLKKILTQVSICIASIASRGNLENNVTHSLQPIARALCGRRRLTYVKREYARVTKTISICYRLVHKAN